MTDQVEVANHPTWTHFIVYLLVVLLATAGGYFMGFGDGKLKGALAAIKATPPIVYSGSGQQIIDQTTKKIGYMFGIKPAKSWGIGICHD